MIRFTVAGVAQPAGSKKGFYNPKTKRVLIVDDAKHSRPWKSCVTDKALEAVAKTGTGLLEGPLVLEVIVHVVRPKGHHGARGLRPSAPPHPTTRPDVTKLLRGIEDALTGICWRDDAQVVHQIATKTYGEPARVDIAITPISELAGGLDASHGHLFLSPAGEGRLDRQRADQPDQQTLEQGAAA